MLLDLRVDNARVRTMDPTRPHATSIGVLHGRVVSLDDSPGGARTPARVTVDVGGRTILPGFVDAHNHLAWAGHHAESVDLSSASDIAHALRLVAEAAARVAPDGWVDVVGYDQRPLGRHLTRVDLDAVSAGRRVYLIHTSGHAHLVNSAVLADIPATALAGAAPDVVRGPDGMPTGLFLEVATRLPAAVRTPHPVADLVRHVERAGRDCARQGITFVAEAGVGGGLTTRSPIEVLAYQDAIDAGRFGLRAQLMVSLDRIDPVAAHPDDSVERALALGLRTGFGSDQLSIGATKAWLDGGMMARTAALTEPYLEPDVEHGRAPQSGALASDLDEIRERARAAHAAGWQLALHAIGDRAVDAALEIVEEAQRAHPRADARHRIEHAGLTRPDQLPRMAAAGVVAVTQPTFLHEFGDDYAALMGAPRDSWLYRGQGYLDAGIALAGSSDRPVADGAPLRGIQFLVERRSREGQLIGADEVMSVDAAVAAYTTGAAYACRVEDRVGHIAPGTYADLVVLDADPWAIDPASIADIPVVATTVGGELVHGEWPASADGPAPA